jgi:diacylglycerol diphosphate phosphatase/phosphatidate phosphatase
MHVLRPRTNLANALLAIAPLLGAALIAISRCEDYRHDVWDVTAGSLLGFVVALFSYKRYYPPLRSRHCGVPYPNPGELAAKKGKNAKGRDEEELANVAQDFELGDSESEEEGREGERLPLTSVRAA